MHIDLSDVSLLACLEALNSSPLPPPNRLAKAALILEGTQILLLPPSLGSNGHFT